ncbi:MAG: 23S rRNA (pseudouridine(1915)-N(3))-methyltransferase RlmH [Chitinophagales bacterium]
MKFSLWVIGKSDKNIESLLQKYEQRIGHYINFSREEKELKKSNSKIPAAQLKRLEAEIILSKLEPQDLLVLLDESGKNYDSRAFATQVEKWMQSSKKQVVFLVGGAFGFAPEIYQRADARLSLSKMTFSHQIIRILFLEQLYRAFSIINKEPYHND